MAADVDWKGRLRAVYSTNPDFKYTDTQPQEPATPEAGRQELRVWLESKRRGGKTVTLVRGFVGREEDLKALAARLKTRCGVGGSVKQGEIIIQGDFRDRVVELLAAEGYRVRKAGG